MPALILHMTLAQRVLEREDLPAELEAACRARPAALLLGSILPDLPYHARFGHQLLRHLLRRDYLHSPWGDVFHTRGTGRMALALLAHAARCHPSPGQRQELLALAAGYLSHHASDRVVHPVIQQMVALRGVPSEPHAVTHSRVERYQSALYHLDLLGYDIACSAFPAAFVRQVAGAALVGPAMPDTLWAATRSACLETHGRAPSTAEVKDWLWGIAAYGGLVSSRLGRIEGLEADVPALRERWYQGPGVDLCSPLERAQDLTAEYWRAALEVARADRITGEVRDTFLAVVPDVDLGTGA